MIRRLRKKFIAAALAAVFLVLLVLIGAINALSYRSLVTDADETLQILADNNGSFPRQMFRAQDRPSDMKTPPSGGGNGPSGERRGGSGELAYQSRFFAAWFSDGSLSRVNLDNLASLSEEEAAALAERVYTSGREKGFADQYRYCRTACGGETMLVFLNCQRELATFRDFLYASIGISLVGTLAVFLLLLLFSGRIVRPIAESYEKQKRFITDAGHELKTPITIIRADADVLESELDGENEWIADIRRQTSRLAELTSDLIYLSKMEEENPALQMQDFSLSELVDETAQSFQSLALAKDRRFSASVAPGLQVSGDEKALGKLVSILLDNAMKYSPENGTVDLTLERAGRNARLIVKNSTPPMEKGNADRLFERFTREDRSRNSESGGFGLGLAIAKAVTEAHGGTIHAESEDGVSLTVTAELPLR
ncbi:MAG: HAMP domain-containing sensor histidine kinase [Eubacteriales bacterium]|nr:HAMP domain-containing sensor histidine kinase [Eubacteriales bacterium]